jgi:phosphatidylinositol kinase/protein kinase (PI-3  family)
MALRVSMALAPLAIAITTRWPGLSIDSRALRVARKHGLLEVCHTSLSRIYMLPNIEISRAFLKLREQARCHYQVPSELNRSQT